MCVGSVGSSLQMCYVHFCVYTKTKMDITKTGIKGHRLSEHKDHRVGSHDPCTVHVNTSGAEERQIGR